MSRTRNNHVRIIAGQWRGSRLPVADLPGLRPTSDRVRETVFNWLMHTVRGARCLDLFAGSGALGVECLSRGAAFVQFVESNPVAADSLKQNVARLAKNLPEPLFAVDSSNAMSLLDANPPTSFDLVFLDPPFASELLQPAAQLLEQNRWLHSGSMVYVEQATRGATAELPENWAVLKEGKTKESRFQLLERQ